MATQGEKGFLALAAGAVLGLVWWASRRKPAGQAARILSYTLKGGSMIASGEIGALLLTILENQNFFATVTIKNTGGVPLTLDCEVQVQGPQTYLKYSNAIPLSPGQQGTVTAPFNLAEFTVPGWAPGTYNLLIRLFSGTTVLDSRVEAGALVVSGVAGPAGQIVSYQLQAG